MSTKKYYIVGGLAILLNGVLVYLLANAAFAVMGWWSVLFFLVEGWLIGRMMGQLMFQWYLSDRHKALVKEWENVEQQTWRVAE